MVVEQRYSNEGLILNKPQVTNWSPTIDAVVANLHNGRETFVTERFLLDSGASMTILGPSLSHLFKGTEPHDKFYVAYGSGKKTLYVFKVKLTVKGGHSFEILAALDNGLGLKHHLLGVTKGFDYFDHVVLNNKLKSLKLIKKY